MERQGMNKDKEMEEKRKGKMEIREKEEENSVIVQDIEKVRVSDW